MLRARGGLSLSKGGPSIFARAYHDESFGYRPVPRFVFPDYTENQLQNRRTNANCLRYVDALRTHGHRAARIDPLDLIDREEVEALNPARYGLTDPQEKFDVNGIVWTKPVQEGDEGANTMWTLEEITRHLRTVYVNRIGYEFMHSPSKSERLWFSHFLESKSAFQPALGNEHKERIQKLLSRSEVFDNFLQQKFPNLKRYGLEGGESMLPALDSLFEIAAKSSVSNIVLAMPHRGRLNLLTDLLKFSPAALFHKISGGSELPESLGAEGDVLSHLVSTAELNYEGAKNPITVELLPNPSHLEAINPVALGTARAKQYSLLKSIDDDCHLGDRVMCVQIHGDAAFTGQGVIMETLGLSNLPHFTSGGSVHLVVDNNIGYTTPAAQARSSLYCSDVGKMINAPVLHVNGDHPEDVARAMEIAFRYREYFRKDIIVDLLVYRRCHNELDLPNLTSPVMYEKIQARKTVPQLYETKLIDEGVVASSDVNASREQYKEHLATGFSMAMAYTPPMPNFMGEDSGLVSPISGQAEHTPTTGVNKQTLLEVGKASVHVPEGFEIHPKLERHVKNRNKALDSEKGLDWATAEALAFGTLMKDGIDVRISGQDVGRGTFSQRHAMLVNQKDESVVVPLNEILSVDRKAAKLELANSSLSEMAVLGFEYGVSWERPNVLPIWEAQFGDFFNGAQVIIDTFISSGEAKWARQSGLVLLLPHGLDGAGPEHSSSRIERWLQLTNDWDESCIPADKFDINMHVVYPTTPSQYFHLLRRQMVRNYRKPLIVAGPKALLRLPAASSPLSEFEEGTSFQPVLADPVDNASSAKTVVFMTGKFYYDLAKERSALGLEDSVALIRIEELSPFPYQQVMDIVSQYTEVQEFCWMQEEHKNAGAWSHIRDKMRMVLQEESHGTTELRYLGRKPSALPATGTGSRYKEQQNTLLRMPFEKHL